MLVLSLLINCFTSLAGLTSLRPLLHTHLIAARQGYRGVPRCWPLDWTKPVGVADMKRGPWLKTTWQLLQQKKLSEKSWSGKKLVGEISSWNSLTRLLCSNVSSKLEIGAFWTSVEKMSFLAFLTRCLFSRETLSSFKISQVCGQRKSLEQFLAGR